MSTRNQRIIAPGLGRLPQFAHATVAGAPPPPPPSPQSESQFACRRPPAAGKDTRSIASKQRPTRIQGFAQLDASARGREAHRGPRQAPQPPRTPSGSK